MSFRHGDIVRLKDCPLDREPIGKVVGHPRDGSQFINVKWPDGWAGYARADELEHAQPFNREALHVARASWLPSANALESADDAVSENVFHGDTRWRLPQS